MKSTTKPKTAAEQCRKWYAENRERKLAYQRAYRKNNLSARLEYDRARWRAQPEAMRAAERMRYARTRDRRVALERARRAANPVAVRARKRAWTLANPDKVKMHARRTRAKHMDRILSANAARKAKIRGARVEKRISRMAIYRRDSGICYLCQLPVAADRFHLDHKIPVSKGGAHTAANLFATHPRCNIQKRDKLINEVHH